MKNIDILLEKYWAGETSLEEESFLRECFQKDNSQAQNPETEIFTSFSMAQKVSFNSSALEKRITESIRHKNKHKHRKIYSFTAISMAASMLLVVGLFMLNNKNEAYVVDKGVRYDDMEKAINCADEAMNEAMTPLRQSMQSLQPIKGLEGALIPSTVKDKNNTLVSNDDSLFDANENE